MFARMCRMMACALATLLVVGLVNPLVLSIPIPEQHRVELNNSVEIPIKGLDIDGCTILDDNTVIVVGGKPVDPNDENIGYVDSPAAGKIISFDTKTMQSFTGGHKKRLCSVAGTAEGAHTVTSSLADPFINVWDVRANKLLNSISFSEKENLCYVACFAKSTNVAVTRDHSINLVNLAKPEKRVELAMESNPVGLAASPDGIHLACLTGEPSDIVIWDVAKATVIAKSKENIVSDKKPDSQFVAMTFSKDAKQLIFARQDGLFRMDIVGKRSIQLGMGHDDCTVHFSLHPSEEWIATVGYSRPDKDHSKLTKANRIGELRIYHYKTGSLALCNQFDRFSPNWVGFTPNGKRLVAISYEGEVRYWNFVVPLQNKP